eukprot:PhF_6_TR22729/c0_g3_i1/m.32386
MVASIFSTFAQTDTGIGRQLVLLQYIRFPCSLYENPKPNDVFVNVANLFLGGTHEDPVVRSFLGSIFGNTFGMLVTVVALNVVVRCLDGGGSGIANTMLFR